MAHEIDMEVRRILDEAYAKARKIVENHNEQIKAMADLLMEKETIYAEDIETILGRSAQKIKAEMSKTDATTEESKGEEITPEM